MNSSRFRRVFTLALGRVLAGRPAGVGVLAFILAAVVPLRPALLVGGTGVAQEGHTAPPRSWDDVAMATLELPLAYAAASPQHVAAEYYYRIPVRPIFKSYPAYALGHEPPGYAKWLEQQEPVVVWDDTGHGPPLGTAADWISAGEMIFDTPIFYTNHRIVNMADVRDPEWYRRTAAPIAKDGTLPFVRYVIRKKGEVDLGDFACAFCHTRVMPDGGIIKGAQGNFPFERSKAYADRASARRRQEVESRDSPSFVRILDRGLFAAPWVKPDPLSAMDAMSTDQIFSAHEAIPPGIIPRHGSNVFYPLQVPDLIGVQERHYLDRTGLQQHRGAADLMRYAALNQGADDLSSYDGFVPADVPKFMKLPDPGDPDKVGGRYSDEQLYALALYLYSLKPPPNPNKFDEFAARGQKVFVREGCARCHTPPLYTNNKLTLAEGFTPPPDHFKRYEILPISVGTDSSLALKTRRGTGYYKVPSLKGVWYRGMFGHSGWCATLEDWFDPNRVRDDYVPTGFKPYGQKTYAVKGHPFGLDLSAEDRRMLLAFLQTL